jgi:hypothetical protein
MNNIYSAFDKLIMLPVVLYCAATSGTADRTVVLLIGARNEQKDTSATSTDFLPGDSLS